MSLSQQASARQESLQTLHSTLENQLRDLSRHPSVSDAEIRKLKRKKLRVKEELESL